MTSLRDRLLGSAWVADRAAAWVVAQRARHRPLAEPIGGEALERIAPYFGRRTLEPVRVRTVPRIDPPAPLAWAERAGRRVVDFDRLWGIALVDTVVLATDVAEPADRIPNLFHECVHVVQYLELGVRGFMRRYVAEWVAARYRYGEIGLEAHAFALQRRFVADAEPFEVDAEVAAWLSGNGDARYA